MEFAAKSPFSLNFDPVPFAIDATANPAGQTPAELGAELGDLGRLSYLRGEVKAKISLNQAITQGSGTLRLTDGTNDYGSVSVAQGDEDGNNDIFKRFSVDVSQASPTARLYLALDVGSAFDASTTAALSGELAVEAPMVIGIC